MLSSHKKMKQDGSKTLDISHSFVIRKLPNLQLLSILNPLLKEDSSAERVHTKMEDSVVQMSFLVELDAIRTKGFAYLELR